MKPVWSSKLPSSDTFFVDGELLAGFANQIDRLDLATGKSLQCIRAPGELVHVGAKTVVFVKQQETARVMSRKTGKLVLEVPLENGRLYFRAPLAWTTERADGVNALRILDPEAKLVTTVGPMKGRLDAVCIDGKRLVIGSADDPKAWLWNGKRSTKIKWKGDEPSHVALSAKHAVIGTEDGRIFVHDARTGALVRELKSKEDRDGSAPIVVSGDRVVGWGDDQHHPILFDPKSGKAIAKLLADARAGYANGAISFSPDGTRVVVAHATEPQLDFYVAKTGKRLAKHTIHRPKHNAVQFRWLDDERVLTCTRADGDHALRLWNAVTGEALWSNLGIGGRALNDIVISARFIGATAWDWPFVRIVDVETGKTVADLPHPKKQHVRRPAFSDAFIATSSNDGPVNLWRLLDRKN